MGRGEAVVVGLVGARGGAGTSCLAAAVACAAERGVGRRGDPVGGGGGAVLVDLTTRGSGVDVLLGIELEPGPRWADLHGARGRLDGEALARMLPVWRGVRVLSADRERPDPLEAGVVVDVCVALARSCDVLVLDLPATMLHDAAPDSAAVLVACDLLLLVTPLDLPAVAGAVAARTLVRDAGLAAALQLVVRLPTPGRMTPWEVSSTLGIPLAATVRWDRGLAASVERGEGPPVGARRLLGQVGRELAALALSLRGAAWGDV